MPTLPSPEEERSGRAQFRCDGRGWHICSRLGPRAAQKGRGGLGLRLGVLLLNTEGLGTMERRAFCVSPGSRTFQVD